MKVVRVFALVSLCALGMGLSGSGCAHGTPCADYEPGVIIIDNREYKESFFEPDWLCYGRKKGEPPYAGPEQPPPPDQPPPPPLDVPDVSMVSPPDPPGPKDSEGVLKAAIMLNSCFLNLHFNEPEINYSISSMYYEFPRRWIHAEMYRRTECFKTKSNGCEAVRECVGLAQTVGVKLPPTEPECADDLLQLSHHYIGKDFTVDTGIDITTWINCKGLDLHCFADFKQDWCSPPRTPCEPDDNAPGCLDGRPYRCADFSKGEEPEYYYYQKLRCSDYGLECPVDAYPAFPDCRATGPACDHKTGDADLAQFSYQYGIACENETTVRACIGGGEAIVDCTSLAKGFKCIPGDKPYCGFASECDEYDEVTCEGDSLVVCDAGRRTKVDCKALGFTSCNAARGVCSPSIYDKLPLE